MLAFREAIYSHTGVNSTGIYALILCNRSIIPCAVVTDKKKPIFPRQRFCILCFASEGGRYLYLRRACSPRCSSLDCWIPTINLLLAQEVKDFSLFFFLFFFFSSSLCRASPRREYSPHIAKRRGFGRLTLLVNGFLARGVLRLKSRIVLGVFCRSIMVAERNAEAAWLLLLMPMLMLLRWRYARGVAGLVAVVILLARNRDGCIILVMMGGMMGKCLYLLALLFVLSSLVGVGGCAVWESQKGGRV